MARFHEVDLKPHQTLKSEESKRFLKTQELQTENSSHLIESLATSEEQIALYATSQVKLLRKIISKTLIEQMQKLHHSEEQQSSLESMYTEAKLSLERSIMEIMTIVF